MSFSVVLINSTAFGLNFPLDIVFSQEYMQNQRIDHFMKSNRRIYPHPYRPWLSYGAPRQ